MFVSHLTRGGVEVGIVNWVPDNQVLIWDIPGLTKGYIAPEQRKWEHNVRNADTNGHSHARAGLIGPSVTIPFRAGELLLGVWQKIVCIDFDDRPRSRKLIVQLLGV